MVSLVFIADPQDTLQSVVYSAKVWGLEDLVGGR